MDLFHGEGQVESWIGLLQKVSFQTPSVIPPVKIGSNNTDNS